MRRLGRRNPVVIGNAAEAAIDVGEWTWAVQVVDEALAEEFEPADRAELLSSALEFQALRGGPIDELAAELERLSEGATDPYRIATLEFGRGWVAFAEGAYGKARDGWRRGIQLTASPEALHYPARAALLARDLDAARTDLAELDASGAHGTSLEADRTTIRAGIAALEGRTAEALTLYREALRAWRDLGLVWDEALAAPQMATLLDP